jgi:hypothetical protein
MIAHTQEYYAFLRKQRWRFSLSRTSLLKRKGQTELYLQPVAAPAS